MRLSFIVVENAEIDIYIATELIRRMIGEADIETFLTADTALDHIALNKAPEADRHIIMLDLMLPKMSGAGFISLFEELPDKIKGRYRILIVTSSMDQAELKRLRKRRNVEMIIEKPLTRDKFKTFLKQIDVDVN